MKQVVATRAFIVNDEGRVLIIREAQEYKGGYQTGKYDLPGGRIEQGESAFAGVKREANEEVGLAIEVGEPFHVSEWYPEIEGEKHQIVGIFFICSPRTMHVTLSEEHHDYEWIDPRAYEQYAIMEENLGAFEAYNNQS